jgi:hypothetical protein
VLQIHSSWITDNPEVDWSQADLNEAAAAADACAWVELAVVAVI